jgi:hypothetical protein
MQAKLAMIKIIDRVDFFALSGERGIYLAGNLERGREREGRHSLYTEFGASSTLCVGR